MARLKKLWRMILAIFKQLANSAGANCLEMYETRAANDFQQSFSCYFVLLKFLYHDEVSNRVAMLGSTRLYGKLEHIHRCEFFYELQNNSVASIPTGIALSPQVLAEKMRAFSLRSEEEGSLWDGKNGDLNDPLDSDGCPDESISVKKCKEIERRRKIGVANKGKVPWNKGGKHSAETRVRIKQRTVEALRDPKVRKKMSEHPRSHTEQSRSRLGLALKKIWARRLKLKKLQQKCYLEWNKLIAEEAKKGWDDQPRLEWDSFEKMQAEILQQRLLWLQSKAEEKRIAKVRAEERAKIRAEKMAMLVKLQKEREDKKKAAKLELRKKMKLKCRQRKKELATVRNLKLKARLIKIHRKKQINGVVTSQEESRYAHKAGATAEKWDIDYIMKEKVEQKLFEDLIRAAKNKSERTAIVNDVESMESILENHFISRDNDCSFPGTKFYEHRDEFSH